MGIGTRKAKRWLTFATLALAAGTVFLRWHRDESAAGRDALPSCRLDALGRQAGKPESCPVTVENGKPEAVESASEVSEEEAKVDAFDELTDKWMEPAAKGVTMADVDSFAKHFRQVPKARQDECIHRALNLIPDENVMLLVGILMDKTMDKEIVETVYNDILNRDEDVKKPILQQIFKDKAHPCWADTAWILDVTGELPQKK